MHLIIKLAAENVDQHDIEPSIKKTTAEDLDISKVKLSDKKKSSSMAYKIMIKFTAAFIVDLFIQESLFWRQVLRFLSRSYM